MTRLEHPSAVDGRALRSALGRFASGVTVVTTEVEDETFGMTANAFTSVSLDPPLVLVSIAATAKMDARIRRAGSYGVSVLRREQEPLSLHFAGAARRERTVGWERRGGVPVLSGSIMQLGCSVVDSHPAGDHTLHVGRVEELWFGNGDPLLFYTGAFRSLEVVRDDHHWF